MNSAFELTPQAVDDIDAIWFFIASDNRDAADRVESEIVASCHRLADHPLIGSSRPNITKMPVRFWTVTKFPNYIIVYRPATVPLQVIGVLHAKRDFKLVLQRFS